MSILSDLKSIIEPLNIPIETGVFSKEAPSEYIVLVPLNDSYPLNADNLPQADVQEVRITVYTKGNYLRLKNKILSTLQGIYEICDEYGINVPSLSYYIIGYKKISKINEIPAGPTPTPDPNATPSPTPKPTPTPTATPPLLPAPCFLPWCPSYIFSC